MNELELAQGKEKSTVIRAIEDLGCNVTAPQLAASTGYPLARSQQLLNLVASETDGDMVVSDKGDVVYKFQKNFAAKYFEDKVKSYLRRAFIIAFEAGFFALRVSFGVMLSLSLLVIVLLVIALIVAACSGSDSGGDVGLPDIGNFDVGSLGDAFAWNYGPGHQEKLFEVENEEKKANFFLEVFSFLFGDGDPNPDTDKLRWQYVAKLIVDKAGVVTAEEIAPYTDGETDSVLSALVRFNGRPEVTETGGIVYLFPELAQQAPELLMSLGLPDPDSIGRPKITSQAGADYYKMVIKPLEDAAGGGSRHESSQSVPSLMTVKRPDFLQEKLWVFSEYPLGSNLFVFTLACINLFGSWWLYRHIATSNLLHHYAYLIDGLLGYAVVFFTLPFLRIGFISIANAFIENRNNKREKALQQLRQPRAELQQTLSESKLFRAELAASQGKTPAKIAYTTEKDNLEQQFEE